MFSAFGIQLVATCLFLNQDRSANNFELMRHNHQKQSLILINQPYLLLILEKSTPFKGSNSEDMTLIAQLLDSFHFDFPSFNSKQIDISIDNGHVHPKVTNKNLFDWDRLGGIEGIFLLDVIGLIEKNDLGVGYQYHYKMILNDTDMDICNHYFIEIVVINYYELVILFFYNFKETGFLEDDQGLSDVEQSSSWHCEGSSYLT